MMKSHNSLSKSSFLIVLLALATTTWAQSGRTIKSNSQLAPTPALPTDTAKPPAEKSKPVIDLNAGKYKLLFPISSEGKNVYDNLAGYKQGVNASLVSLVKELNRAGAQGYRLVSAEREYYVALMKLDEGQYEYRHFEMINNFTRWRADFREQHDRLTKEGFRFVNFYSLYKMYEIFNPEVSAVEEGEFFNSFFYEKDQSTRQASKQLLVTAKQTSNEEQAVGELTAQIREKLAAGYYPVGVLSPFETLLEQVSEKDDLVSERPEVQMAFGARLSKVKNKVDALAKQGYRIWSGNNGAFLLFRRNSNQLPVSYIWLHPAKKNYEKELTKLAAQGAVYRAVYVSDADDWENVLLFEMPPAGGGDLERRDYKALKFDFNLSENTAENRAYLTLTDKSKATLKTMEQLVKEGFEARDLFVTGGKEDAVSVLLEREAN